MTLDERLKDLADRYEIFGSEKNNLLAALRKCREQRDNEHKCLVVVGDCQEMDAYDTELLKLLEGDASREGQ